MTFLAKRLQAELAAFKHDTDLNFRVISCRNRRFAYEVARSVGYTEEAASNLARRVVDDELCGDRGLSVVERVIAALARDASELDVVELERRLQAIDQETRRELTRPLDAPAPVLVATTKLSLDALRSGLADGG